MDQTCLISNAKEGSIRLLDLKTGSLLFSFKQNVHQSNPSGGKIISTREYGSSLLAAGSLPGCTTSDRLLTPKNMFASLQADRPLMNIYGWGKEFPRLRFSLPEAMSSVGLAPSRFGTGLCVTGSCTGRLYFWELPSGRLARVVDAHYKAIRSLVFNLEGNVLVTASDDASVHVWHLAEIYHPKLPPVPKPLHAWSDHSLPVTDILISQGQGSLRVFTASLDATCKVWDLTTGLLLATYLLPSPVTAIALNSREASLVAGCENGLIYLIPLYENASCSSFQPLQSKLGNGTVISIEESSSFENQARTCFTGHKSSVTSIKFDLTGTLLVSGDKDGQTFVWDVSSRQSLRFLDNGITPSTSGAVTSLNVFSTPHEFLRPGISTSEGFPNLSIFNKVQQDLETLAWLPPLLTKRPGSEFSSLSSEVPYPGLLPLDLLDYDETKQFGVALEHSTFLDSFPNFSNSTNVTNPEGKTSEEIEALQSDLLELYKTNLELQKVNDRLYERVRETLS